MLLQWGSLSLNLIQIHDYKREAVFSGPNYLYTTHTLAVRAYLNPGTQSDSFPGQPTIGPLGTGLAMVPPALPNARFIPGGPPSVSPAVGPGVNVGGPARVPGTVSDLALRHVLMQPRQNLRLSVAGIYTLISPTPGMAVDCTNGPIPLGCHVEQVGPRTWVVDFVIKTDLNEAFLYKGVGQLPILLANQYKMRHELDEDFFTARVIEGRATFRSDALALAGLQPDDCRAALMMDPPAGWKRDKVHVQAEEDGCTLHYLIVDRQLPLGWKDANVTRMEATHTIHISKAEPEQVIAQAALKGTRDILEYLSRETVEPLVGGGNVGAPVAIAARLGLTAAEAAWGVLPTATHNVHVELWGHPNSTRLRLENFGRDVIAARINGFFAAAGLAVGMAMGADIVVRHDIMRKSVVLDYTFQTGPIQTAASFGLAQLQFQPIGMPAGDNTGALIAPGLNVPGPNDDGVARGTYLANCVAAALVARDSEPPIPFSPRDRKPGIVAGALKV